MPPRTLRSLKSQSCCSQAHQTRPRPVEHRFAPQPGKAAPGEDPTKQPATESMMKYVPYVCLFEIHLKTLPFSCLSRTGTSPSWVCIKELVTKRGLLRGPLPSLSPYLWDDLNPRQHNLRRTSCISCITEGMSIAFKKSWRSQGPGCAQNSSRMISLRKSNRVNSSDP